MNIDWLTLFTQASTILIPAGCILSCYVAVGMYLQWPQTKWKEPDFQELKSWGPALLRYFYVGKNDWTSVKAALQSAIQKGVYRSEWGNEKTHLRLRRNSSVSFEHLRHEERAVLTKGRNAPLNDLILGPIRRNLHEDMKVRLFQFIRNHYRSNTFPKMGYSLILFVLHIGLLAVIAKYFLFSDLEFWLRFVCFATLMGVSASLVLTHKEMAQQENWSTVKKLTFCASISLYVLPYVHLIPDIASGIYELTTQDLMSLFAPLLATLSFLLHGYGINLLKPWNQKGMAAHRSVVKYREYLMDKPVLSKEDLPYALALEVPTTAEIEMEGLLIQDGFDIH
ncbi:MAG: hypothetical protein AAF587_31720 [Bacteroidota bacterium]